MHWNKNSSISGVLYLDLYHGEISLLCWTDPDSYASIVIVGKNGTIINNAGLLVEVSPFTLDYNSLSKVHKVDTSIRCNLPFSSETCLLIVRHFLIISAMDLNYTPPFIIRLLIIDARNGPKI